jgi:hypothetical protein
LSEKDFNRSATAPTGDDDGEGTTFSRLTSKNEKGPIDFAPEKPVVEEVESLFPFGHIQSILDVQSCIV